MKVNVKIKLGDKVLLDLDNQSLQNGKLLIDKGIDQHTFNKEKGDNNVALLEVEFS